MKKTLVFGASVRPGRYSNLAIKRLVERNIETAGFGLREGMVAGVPIKTTLESFERIHTITIYMNPQRQKAFYDDILRLAPQRVIFNPGTENPEFYKKLKEAGIDVEVSCTLVLLATGMF